MKEWREEVPRSRKLAWMVTFFILVAWMACVCLLILSLQSLYEPFEPDCRMQGLGRHVMHCDCGDRLGYRPMSGPEGCD